MADRKDVNVFRIEYELLPSMSTWTAHIVAFSHEEALLYLRKKVGAHRIIASGLQSRVDAISEEVRNVIINKALGTQVTPPNPEKVTKIGEGAERKEEEKQPVKPAVKKSTFSRK